jgi:hypothetical protein
MERKICNICNKEKEISEYYKNKYSRDGLRSNCKVCQNINSKKWRELNPEKYKEIQKNFLNSNPGISSQYSKKWKVKNKEIVKTYSREYKYLRYNTDVQHKLIKNLRNRLNDLFRNNNFKKNSRFIDYLGCDTNFLVKYMEAKFQDGMTWENKGFHGWHIDHIIPLSTAKNEDDIFKLCHYTNLQPLWAQDNLSKGSKII